MDWGFGCIIRLWTVVPSLFSPTVAFCRGVPVARVDFLVISSLRLLADFSTESGSPVEASGELAPSTRLRREGPEDWTWVLAERCARKQKSVRFLPRSLLEKMKRATEEDDEFRVRVECRRSSRLSHSLPPTSPDLGVFLEDGLPPIVEVMESIEEIRPPVVASDGAQVGQSLVVFDGLLSVGREGGMDLGSSLVVESPSDFEGSQAKDDGGRQMVDGGDGGQGDADLPMASVSFFCFTPSERRGSVSLFCRGGQVIPETGSSDVSSLDSSAMVLSSVEEAQVADLVEKQAVAGVGQGGLVKKQAVPPSSSHGPPTGCGQQVPRVDGQ
ncbi:hypothetical protein Dimus_036480, partial [Dionaea muscipula]